MDLKRALVAAVLVAPLICAVQAAPAYAAGPGGAFGAYGTMLPAAAKYLGLTQQTLEQDMRSGKTLQQLATGEKKSVQGLESALTAAIKAAIHKELKAGQITSAQASAEGKQAAAEAKSFVTGKGFGGHPSGSGYSG